jgi:hypothetical protein
MTLLCEGITGTVLGENIKRFVAFTFILQYTGTVVFLLNLKLLPVPVPYLAENPQSGHKVQSGSQLKNTVPVLIRCIPIFLI